MADPQHDDGAAKLREEFAALEHSLADPAVHADVSRARKLGRRHGELVPVIRAFDERDALRADHQAALELAGEDPSFRAEAEALESQLVEVEQRLVELLAPRDPHDSCDAIMEIQSGAGGEESALFAGDLLRMYTRYAESVGWSIDVLDATESDLGGYKDVRVIVKSGKVTDAHLQPFAVLKFEGGVHRVQRVPVTESQGRIHTSAAGVLVLPDVDDEDVQINEEDLRIDVFRSSGPGGQGVNTTDSAVRITHLPSGIVVSSQNERSQMQNKQQALRVLRARLIDAAEAEAAAAASEARRSQVRTVDRSERIRTYNFPENRIADHRIGYKAHNLDQVLDGDLQPLMTALADADRAARIADQA